MLVILSVTATLSLAFSHHCHKSGSGRMQWAAAFTGREGPGSEQLRGGSSDFRRFLGVPSFCQMRVCKEKNFREVCLFQTSVLGGIKIFRTCDEDLLFHISDQVQCPGCCH